MGKLTQFAILATGIFLAPIRPAGAQEASAGIWGKTPDGADVSIFTLTNNRGTRVRVAEYGALLVSLETKDKEGQLDDITLSYQSFDEALKGGVFGSVIGRFANRIGGGGFSIDGKRYDLESVNPKTGVHIHGGKTGFHRQLWKGSCKTTDDAAVAGFHLTSPDGHEGYPGTVEVSVTYTLTNDNVLRLEYRGKTDQTTPLNLTNHAYFNLAGSGAVLDHQLKLLCLERLVVDENKVPTGEIVPVSDTVFDFRKLSRIGESIAEVEGGGYDHCFVIPQLSTNEGPNSFATLVDPNSGRTLEVSTTKPGVQIYTANHFKGKPFPKWGGICFETQHFPDAPNRRRFPESFLRPGEKYHHVTEFRFGVVTED